VPAAIGFLTSMGSIGAVSIPTGVGWIADRVTLEIVPMVLLPLAILMVILHRWLMRHSPGSAAAS